MHSVPHNNRNALRNRAEFGRARTTTLVACAASVALVSLGVGTGHRALSSVGPALGAERAAPVKTTINRGLLAKVLPLQLGASGFDDRPPVRASGDSTPSTLTEPALSQPSVAVESAPDASDLAIYNGRPVRAVSTIRMKVTAYSPDFRSCGLSADGITASGYSVLTNGGCMVAADPRVLPLGSLVSVPGYDHGAVVPVLDTGGAIKGQRLDVLYPTHEIARRWGVQDIEVTVWEYADGLPNGFRRLRRP